ncbi:MAG: hypothetical protein ACFFAZ_06840 [Promethearchaeota archaeon]
MGLVSKILGIGIAASGIVILFFGSSDPVWSFGYYILGLILMSVGLTLVTSRSAAGEKKPPPPTVTDIRCDNLECTFKEIRDFQKGDYILKPMETQCPKCQSTMTIQGVYIVREQEPE